MRGKLGIISSPQIASGSPFVDLKDFYNRESFEGVIEVDGLDNNILEEQTLATNGRIVLGYGYVICNTGETPVFSGDFTYHVTTTEYLNYFGVYHVYGVCFVHLVSPSAPLSSLTITTTGGYAPAYQIDSYVTECSDNTLCENVVVDEVFSEIKDPIGYYDSATGGFSSSTTVSQPDRGLVCSVFTGFDSDTEDGSFFVNGDFYPTSGSTTVPTPSTSYTGLYFRFRIKAESAGA